MSSERLPQFRRRVENDESCASISLERVSSEFPTPRVQARRLACMWLSGSQVQMGEQYGRLMLQIGGWEPVADYYPRMAAQMLSVRTNARSRQRMESALRVMLKLPTASMCRARRKFFPEYEARTRAGLQSAGVTLANADHFVAMDVFQNIVGLADRWGLLPELKAHAAIAGNCTSLAVWGAASSDGSMRTARNFDFPGVGRWDAAPSVVFCKPNDGQRYGYVGARGADVPGVSAFNESGISVCAHTRFHRDVSFRQAAVVDVGHEIARRAHSLSDAIEIAKKYPTASTWGFLVTSASEKNAVVIETNAGGCDVYWPHPQSSHLAHANRYMNERMCDGQTRVSATFTADSEMRFRRMDEAAAQAGRSGGLCVQELCELLGDHVDPEAKDHQEPGIRVAGNCVTSPITVQSVVFEPEHSRVHVSVGEAPTGWGPYISVDWHWRNDSGVEVLSEDSTSGREASVEKSASSRSTNLTTNRSVQAYQDYVALAHEHLEGAPYEKIAAGIEALVEWLPEEPHFQYLQAMALLQRGAFEDARKCLDKALAIEAGMFRRAQYLLWQSRVLEVLNEKTSAAALRQELLDMKHPQIVLFQADALAEQKKPKAAERLERIALDLLLIDAHWS